MSQGTEQSPTVPGIKVEEETRSDALVISGGHCCDQVRCCRGSNEERV
jgi:hypothetical protein